MTTRRSTLPGSRLSRRHRALLYGSVAVAVVASGAVGAATAAAPSSHAAFTRVDTGGTFLPTTGPQRTLIVAPDHQVYAPPKDVPPVPDPAFLQQVPGGPCTAD